MGIRVTATMYDRDNPTFIAGPNGSGASGSTIEVTPVYDDGGPTVVVQRPAGYRVFHRSTGKVVPTSVPRGPGALVPGADRRSGAFKAKTKARAWMRVADTILTDEASHAEVLALRDYIESLKQESEGKS